MAKIGENFNHTDWTNAMQRGGELRLRTGPDDKPQIYNARQTLSGKAVGFMRGLIPSAGRTAKRQAAANELKAFLGKHGQAAFDHAGIVPGKAITARQISSALAFTALQGKFGQEAFDHAGIVSGQPITAPQLTSALDYIDQKRSRSLDVMIRNPDAFVYSTKIRDLVDLEKRANTAEKKAPLTTQINALKKFTVATQIDRIAQKYDDQFASRHSDKTNEAMKLAITMKSLGRQIATQDLNNPRAHGAINEQLFRSHADELTGKHGEDVIKLARSLAGNDVMMRALQGKVSVEEATYQVRVLAERAGTTPGEMFDLIREQFEAEVGSLSHAEVAATYLAQDGYHPGGDFNLDEIKLVGQMSPKLFTALVGEENPTFTAKGLNYAKPSERRRLPDGSRWLHTRQDADTIIRAFARNVAKWKDETGISKVIKRENGKFELANPPEKRPQNESLVRYRALPEGLREQIDAFGGADNLDKMDPNERVALPGTRGVTENQYALLREIRRQEPILEMTPDSTGRSPQRQVLDFFKQRYGLTDAEAARVLDKAKEWFKIAPLTITFKGDDTFAKGPDPVWGTRYKAAQEIGTNALGRDQIGDLVGGSGEKGELNTPSNTGFVSRGINYLRWRVEKDDEETRHRELGRTEQAIFGAVNINFGKTGGFEADSSAYGESHMLLDGNIRDRVAFNFNKSRELRAGVTMLMYDMIHNKNVDDASSGKDRSMFVDAIVHNALGLPGIVRTPMLQLEVEIFGELDMKQDVTSVRVPTPGRNNVQYDGTTLISDDARANLTTFFGNKVQNWDLGGIRDVNGTNQFMNRPDLVREVKNIAQTL